MPELVIPLDSTGKITIRLYVGVGRNRAEFLRSAGHLIPPVRPITALVDTGASQTVIEESLLRGLDLSPVGEELVHTASSARQPVRANLYVVELSSAQEVTGTFAANLQVVATSDLSGLNVQALLGRDILMRADWAYDRNSGRFRISLDEAI